MDQTRFFMFYTVFFLFVTYVSALAGPSLFSGADAFQDLAGTSDATFNAWNLVNPLYIVGLVGSLLSISTEFTLLYILVLAPFLVGLVINIAKFIRGVS